MPNRNRRSCCGVPTAPDLCFPSRQCIRPRIDRLKVWLLVTICNVVSRMFKKTSKDEQDASRNRCSRLVLSSQPHICILDASTRSSLCSRNQRDDNRHTASHRTATPGPGQRLVAVCGAHTILGTRNKPRTPNQQQKEKNKENDQKNKEINGQWNR